ncbi:hypothetical protein [Bacillus sp. CGMCC 1.16541]|uniref:hypothetical protein n=1 Tax=Bacillus sp. CGMCC 1.16541 TaxID=2185143 RepID=UPI000D72DBEA|nr:hypothetical protein [Bacillus sp. CGMCC 1.16541]
MEVKKVNDPSMKSSHKLKLVVIFCSGFVQLYTYYMISAMSLFFLVDLIYRLFMDVDKYVAQNGIGPSTGVLMFVGLTVVPLLTMGLTYSTMTVLRKKSWRIVGMIVGGHLIMAITLGYWL